ncbi:hypothetical protein EB061_10085 [bacterium]|nr:hypothetical protein [bacterium]
MAPDLQNLLYMLPHGKRPLISIFFVLFLLNACTWEGREFVSLLNAPSASSKGATAPNGTYAGLGLLCLDENGGKTSSYVFNSGSPTETVKLTDGLYEIQDESTLCKTTFSGVYQVISANSGNTLLLQSSVSVSPSNSCTIGFSFNRESIGYPEIPASAFRQTNTSYSAPVTKLMKMIYDPETRTLYLSTDYSTASKEQCYIAYLKK